MKVTEKEIALHVHDDDRISKESLKTSSTTPPRRQLADGMTKPLDPS
jgi:hypothetical protein